MSLIPERRAPGAPGVAKCLGDAVEAGRLSRAQAEEALATVRRMMEEKALPEDAAAAAAAAELTRAAELRQRQAALQILATHRRLADARSHEKGTAAGVAAVFARDLWGRARYSNVEARMNAIRGELHARFAAGMDAFRNRMLGLSSDTISPQRMIRELYGEATNDAVAMPCSMSPANAASPPCRTSPPARGW